jgi:hypothetical protein
LRVSEGLALFLRLGAATLYIVVGASACIGLIGHYDLPPMLMVVALLVLIGTAVPLFNEGLLRKLKGRTFEDDLRDREAQGKLVRERVAATRALYFEDLDTGCDTYLLELGSGGVLCIHGQYGFEPCDDEDETQPRQFPRRAFDLLRKRSNGHLVHIDLHGEVFEPEVVVPELKALHALGIDLDDGAVYPALEYDDVRAAASRGMRDGG